MRRLAFFFVLALSGCRWGEAHFTTSFDGVAFDPGGTVFAYLDERDSALVEDADPRVVVAMTWIVFDPQSDLNDLDGPSLSAMSHEMEVRDTLVLVFDHQGAVDEGEEFDDDSDAAGGALDVRLHFAPERLSAASTFEDLKPFASRRVSKVEVDVASFDEASPVIAGTFEVELAAVEGRDPGSAREGTVEGTFRAPLVAERTAEQNLALLDQNGVLGLPLGDRK